MCCVNQCAFTVCGTCVCVCVCVCNGQTAFVILQSLYIFILKNPIIILVANWKNVKGNSKVNSEILEINFLKQVS